jgi:hypothetical protein
MGFVSATTTENSVLFTGARCSKIFSYATSLRKFTELPILLPTEGVKII